MNSTSGDLISLAIQRSFSPKNKTQSLDDHIVANARRILSTKIDYVLTAKHSTASFLENLKNKYIVLKPNKKNKKKKKIKNCDNKIQMKNTELSGQNLSLPAPKIVLFSPDAVQLGWKNIVPVGSGFVNSGTTCYINSTLQALFHVPSFVNWLLDDKRHATACEKTNGFLHTECIVCAMSKTLHQSHRFTGNSVRPRLIIEKVKTICKHLSPFRQEDAHEFLRYLMEAMEKSYTAILGIQVKKLDSYSKETTPLNQIFGGYIRTEVTCLECSQISTTFQHFQDLILDIRQTSTSTVYDALENYFSKERLDGDESYHCEHCKKKVSAYKKFSIEKAPNALCIQLKRFNINSFYGGSKISKLISIPQNIDLSKFKHKRGSPNGTPLKYKLVSMVFHHGPSANSGHYTALGCTSSGSYYYFNDEQVYATHLGQYTNNPNAYIMFYELEKSQIPETSPTKPLSNGCSNGNVQRTNGFFTKRETFTSNHSKQPWEYCETKYSPIKASAVVSKTSTSLVPYMSSDSDDSDTENDKDKNNNSHDEKTLSPLAKRNSTLTSLLTSSPKNETCGKALSKPMRLDLFDDNDKGIEVKPEKRAAIAFSFNKKKDDDKKIGIATPHCTTESQRNEIKEDKKDEINGLGNGTSKANCNGNSKIASNGWIITKIEEEFNDSEKAPTSGVARSEWIVTEKNKNSPTKECKQNENQENCRKYYNGNDETKCENNTNDSQNGSNSYSSYNGYGGKVLKWDGEVSYINQESEKERKESLKRSYSYDDDMDRGKVKKPKYYNRNENGNGNNFPRKNPFQQYYNNYYGSKKQSSWTPNRNGYNGNNRRYQHNNYYRPNHHRASNQIWRR